MRTWLSALEGSIQGSWWLFDVATTEPSTYKWSLGQYTAYSQQIIPDSFAGIELTRNRTEFGIVAPSTINFAISDAAGAFTDPSIFKDAVVTISLKVRVASTTYSAYTWTFICTRCDGGRGRLEFVCVDVLSKYLKGTWPNQPLLSSLVQEETAGQTPDDNVCVPVTVGTAYIPLRSLFLGASYGRQYLLGPATGTYTVAEVHSPSDGSSGNSRYAATDFTFTQASFALNGTSYRMLAPKFALNSDGVTYDVGLFPGFKDAPTLFTHSSTVSLTNPVDWIEYVLLDFGVPAALIDSASFLAAKASVAAMGIEVNGGYWFPRPRMEILAELLNSCHCCLDVTDKVAIRVLSEAYDVTHGTITTGMVIKAAGKGDRAAAPESLLSAFRYQPVTQVNNDGGYVSFPQALDVDGDPQPQDKLIKVMVPVGTTAPANLSAENLTLSLINDSVVAQKLATLYFERRFLRDANITFKAKPAAMALQPDDVIHFADAYFGGTYDALIESVRITRQLAIEIQAVRYSQALSTFAGLTFDAVVVAVDGTATSATWQTITAGPISYPSKGNGPNCLPGKLVIGSNGQVVLDPTITAGIDWRILVGSLDPTLAPFRVDEMGNVFCDSITEAQANIVHLGRFELARNEGDWSGGEVVTITSPSGSSFTKALRVSEHGVVEGPYRRAVSGDILYFSCWLNTTLSSLPVFFGLQTVDTTGAIAKYAPDSCTLAAGQGWTKVTGSMAIPADTSYFAPTVCCTGTYATGSFDVAELIISRHQLGATMGAEFGYTMFGGGTGQNQVGNDGMISEITAGIVNTGALVSINYDATHGIAFDLDNATIEVNEAGGLVVNASGGVSVASGGGIDVADGGDISLNAVSGNLAYLKFLNSGITNGQTSIRSWYSTSWNSLQINGGSDSWLAIGYDSSTSWEVITVGTRVGTDLNGIVSFSPYYYLFKWNVNDAQTAYSSFEAGGSGSYADRGFRCTASDVEYLGGRMVNSGGVFVLREVSSAPGSITDCGQFFTKSDNAFYFMDGAGTVHTVCTDETGTFTPGLTFGGGNTGMTISSQYGNYRKHGGKCKFTLRLYCSAKGSSTGAAVVTGLPFTSISDALYREICPAVIAVSSSCGAIGNSATTIDLVDDYNLAARTDADFPATFTIYISGEYLCA